MMNTKKQLEAMMRLCIADTEAERQEARRQVQEMLNKLQAQEPENVIRAMLFELGAPEHLAGHAFAVEALLLCLENRMYINSITFGLYPQIAAKFDTTASRVERSIRHFIEVTWERGNIQAQDRYFGSTIKEYRGKPTNGEFIARMTNIARRKIDEVA